MVSQPNKHNYGIGSSSYIAAGELAGIEKLVDTFYSIMETSKDAKKILAMHPSGLLESRKKLSYFLSGWLGGPRLYSEHYGQINIPSFHQHLDIGIAERDAWLMCMQKAIIAQPYSESFKSYLYSQLCIPANLIEQFN